MVMIVTGWRPERLRVQLAFGALVGASARATPPETPERRRRHGFGGGEIVAGGGLSRKWPGFPPDRIATTARTIATKTHPPGPATIRRARSQSRAGATHRRAAA
jgi:hypothetical protein